MAPHVFLHIEDTMRLEVMAHKADQGLFEAPRLAVPLALLDVVGLQEAHLFR